MGCRGSPATNLSVETLSGVKISPEPLPDTLALKQRTEWLWDHATSPQEQPHPKKTFLG